MNAIEEIAEDTTTDQQSAASIDEPEIDEAALRHTVDTADIAQAEKMTRDNDDRALYRYMRVRAGLSTELQVIEEQSAAMIRQLKVSIERLDSIYMPIVADIARRKLAGGKVKSLRTPWGLAGFRKIPSNIEIIDAPTIIEAVVAGNLPETCQRVRIEPSKSGLTEHFKTTGELPPGTRLIEEHDRFYVRP